MTFAKGGLIPQAAPGSIKIREGQFIITTTGAACPKCGTKLESRSRVTRSIATDAGVEVHVHAPELVCPSDGCDIGVVSLGD